MGRVVKIENSKILKKLFTRITKMVNVVITGKYWYPPVLTGTNSTNRGAEGVKQVVTPHITPTLITSTRCTNIIDL